MVYSMFWSGVSFLTELISSYVLVTWLVVIDLGFSSRIWTARITSLALEALSIFLINSLVSFNSSSTLTC
jgi:hypothetical protein